MSASPLEPPAVSPSSSSVSANLPEPGFSFSGAASALMVTVVLGVLAVAAVAVTWRETSGVTVPAPPAILVRAAVPTPQAVGSGEAVSSPGTIVSDPTHIQQHRDLARFGSRLAVHIPARWVAGFYPLYDTAARTFSVNWLLLASIHAQETAFSSEPSTYQGLNFAHCCGGPMQFNVTNHPVSTWSLVSDSYRYGRRPAAYPHATAVHPSIYDDFDAMMAAARLLSADGAGVALDGSAWQAAYDYYGHDSTGVTYADEVLGRAISWSQRGFCVNCAVDSAMVSAAHGAYGVAALAALAPLPASPAPARAHRRRSSGATAHSATCAGACRRRRR